PPAGARRAIPQGSEPAGRSQWWPGRMRWPPEARSRSRVKGHADMSLACFLVERLDLDVSEKDLGRFNFKRDPALGDRLRLARLVRVDEADVFPFVDDVAVQDVGGARPACDDLDGIPALDLEIARQPLLVADAFAAEHARLAAAVGAQERGDLLLARFRV